MSTNSESEIVRSFLRASTTYLFSCAYRDSLRAAFARRAARDPVLEHALHYRELLARETAGLVRTQRADEACAFAATIRAGEIVRPGA